MRIPPGCDFKTPDHNNHFCGIFAYHKESKTLYNDDTINFTSRKHNGRILNLCYPCIGDTLSLHPQTYSHDSELGLFNKKESVLEFKKFLEDVQKDWDFENICTAHWGNVIGNGNLLFQTLLDANVPSLLSVPYLNSPQVALVFYKKKTEL